jgi:hypothetical protein
MDEGKELLGDEDQNGLQRGTDSDVPPPMSVDVLQARIEEQKRLKMELELLTLEQENATSADSVAQWEVTKLNRLLVFEATPEFS